MVYEYPSNSPGKSLRPARDPIILTLPEETERRHGFSMNMVLDEDEQKFFTGLFPLNSTTRTSTRTGESATDEYRSYECLKTIDTALAVLAKAREHPDSQPISTTRECRNTAPPPPRASLRDINHQQFDHPHNNKQQQ